MAHWQKNQLAVQPLMCVTNGWAYDPHYRTGFDETMKGLQDWTYQQAGATFRLLPTKNLYLPLTAEEYKARPNFYYDVRDHLNAKTYYDSTGQRVDFCNWRRLYVLGATGEVRTLENMAGRSSWGCAPAPDNKLEPWGPGVTGGPSSWATELLRGNAAWAEQLGMPRIDGKGNPLINKMRGALLHELYHCLGLRHPTEPGSPIPADHTYGSDVWLSPMAGWWFFGSGGRLFPEEVAYLRSVPFLTS